jgi:hypothetical protein
MLVQPQTALLGFLVKLRVVLIAACLFQNQLMEQNLVVLLVTPSQLRETYPIQILYKKFMRFGETWLGEMRFGET